MSRGRAADRVERIDLVAAVRRRRVTKGMGRAAERRICDEALRRASSPRLPGSAC